MAQKQITAKERMNIMRKILKCVASDIVATQQREKGNPDHQMAWSGGATGALHEVSSSGAGQLSLMAFAPRLQCVDYRTQAFADLRQPILDPRRHLGIDL